MIELSPSEVLILVVCLLSAGYLARCLYVDLRRSRRHSKRFAHLLQNAPGQKPGQKEDRS